MINKLFGQARNPADNNFQQIQMVGPKGSGKTTYMAALASAPNTRPDDIQSVTALDDESQQLIDMAEGIVAAGMDFAPTNFVQQYTLQLQVKKQIIPVCCLDYPGEFFRELREMPIDVGQFETCLDGISRSSGLLILFDSKNSQLDQQNAQAIPILKRALNERLFAQGRDLSRYRIALVFSKAEQAPAWIYAPKHQENIKSFISANFPRSVASLTQWRQEWKCQVNTFFVSAFGTLGSPARPNVSSNGRTLANPNLWRPLGLAAPVYWLSTGKDDIQLRRMSR